VTARLRWAEQHLNYRFANPGLLEQALTHRSASKTNNERLEFLGDALLTFLIARQLYESRPADKEGDLSRLRAELVKGETLAQIGLELGFEDRVILGTGESRSGGARRTSVLANAFEAVIGAVLLDGGVAAAETCATKIFAERLGDLPEAASLKDPKTKLQEWIQGRGLGLPTYVVESVVGEPHQQSFTVVCRVPERQAEVCGEGDSRRRAEQDAAERMLSILSSEHE